MPEVTLLRSSVNKVRKIGLDMSGLRASSAIARLMCAGLGCINIYLTIEVLHANGLVDVPSFENETNCIRILQNHMANYHAVCDTITETENFNKFAINIGFMILFVYCLTSRVHVEETSIWYWVFLPTFT